VVVAGKILSKTVKDMYVEEERKLTAKASTIGSIHIKPGMLGKILSSSVARPSLNIRPTGSTRPGQNGSREINLSKLAKIIRA
jgi:hypothetical protein